MSLDKAIHDANRAIAKAAIPLTPTERTDFFAALIETLTDLVIANATELERNP